MEVLEGVCPGSELTSRTERGRVVPPLPRVLGTQKWEVPHGWSSGPSPSLSDGGGMPSLSSFIPVGVSWFHT